MTQQLRHRIAKGLFLAMLFAWEGSHAQQEAMYSQYMFNMLAVNPAYAGSRNVLSLTGLYRNNFTGFEGAPVTQTFTLDAPVQSERIGLGVQMFNDKLGVIGSTGAYGTFAFRVKVTTRATLGMGIQAGVTNFRADLASVNTGSPDPAFNRQISKFLPNFGTGLFFSTDRFYVGVSVPQLIRGKINEAAQDTAQFARQQRHFFGMAGLVLPISRSVVMKPSVLVKAVAGAPAAVDINTNFWFNERFGIGGSYRIGNAQFNRLGGNARIGNAVVGMMEIQLTEQLRLGYAYDYLLNEARELSGIGSHEVLLRYEFGYSKKKILTPRYF